MSPYQAAPRLGHLEALYSIVYFLKMNSFKRIVFDPTRPFIDESRFMLWNTTGLNSMVR